MHYRDIPHKIIIEQYLGDAINDYKFMCFGGNPVYVQVDFNRFANHTRNFYDMAWNIQPFISQSTPMDSAEHKCPAEYTRMKEIARELSRGFDQVRVDLYLIDGHIYFGEMTFTDGSGFCQNISREVGFKVGALWPFDNTARARVLAQNSRP